MKGKKNAGILTITIILILGMMINSGCQSKLDLSTPEKAAEVIMTALKGDDAETFRKCISSQTLKMIEEKNAFDKYFTTWKKGMAWFSSPKDFVKGVKLTNENGSWKLDEK